MVEDQCVHAAERMLPVGIGELPAEGVDDHSARVLARLVVEIGGVDQAGAVDARNRVLADVRGAGAVRVHTAVLPARVAFYAVPSNGRRGRDQCMRTVCPGRIWATLSMSSSATTPITGYPPVTGWSGPRITGKPFGGT